MDNWTGIFFCISLLVVGCIAQAPPNTPCTIASRDCCTSAIEHVTIGGIVYSHQICKDKTPLSCTQGCGCIGLCSDSTARCSCITPTATMAPSISFTPSMKETNTPLPSVSSNPSATPGSTSTMTITQSRFPGACKYPSVSMINPNVTTNGSNHHHQHHHHSKSNGSLIGGLIGGLFGFFIINLCTMSTCVLLGVRYRHSIAKLYRSRNTPNDTVPLHESDENQDEEQMLGNE